MPWWVRVFHQTSLVGVLRNYIEDRSSEDAEFLARRIFRGDGEHSIFKATTVADVNRIVAAFSLHHPMGRLQARAAAWSEWSDLAPLEAAGKVEKTPGDTPDDDVNDRHYVLCRLTGDDLRGLLDSLVTNGRSRKWSAAAIVRGTRLALARPGRIDPIQLTPNMIETLDEMGLWASVRNN
ncbi:MAG TPA: hypothetical protein VK669_10545 [Candidatus Limnocylindrales bacterium]|nr:hypothetical protein [Candidatus Limnocylindrales bacterium]